MWTESQEPMFKKVVSSNVNYSYCILVGRLGQPGGGWPGWGVWVGTLIFKCIHYVGLADFSRVKILNLDIFAGFQKQEYILRYEDFYGYFSLAIFLTFTLPIQKGSILGLYRICLIFFWRGGVVNSRCEGRAYVARKK